MRRDYFQISSVIPTTTSTLLVLLLLLSNLLSISSIALQNAPHYVQRHAQRHRRQLRTIPIPKTSTIITKYHRPILTLSSSSSSNNKETESFSPPTPPPQTSNDNTFSSFPPSSSSSSSASAVLQQKRQLTQEFFSIALPAFLQLTAEPLAGLVDTAYLGRLGPDILGGAGVAISAQYAVSKLYNDPLLRTSISLVASEDGKNKKNRNTIMNENGNGDGDASAFSDDGTKQLSKQQQQQQHQASSLSIAVSSAILLAFTVGAIQLLLYYTFASSILRGMGISPVSSMYPSAYSYLRIRALGTPAATLWLVTNGIYRGLGDTSTPLKYSLAFTVLNAILDPIFIFTWKFGASGAAAGTALAQYAALVPLMYSLHQRVGIDVLGQWRMLGNALKEYLRAGTYVFARTIGKVLAYSVCARQAVSCFCLFLRVIIFA